MTGDLVNSVSGIPYGMIFGSTEDQILILIGDKLIFQNFEIGRERSWTYQITYAITRIGISKNF